MTPFVLYARPIDEDGGNNQVDANVTRYCDILSSIETLIEVSEWFASSVHDIYFRQTVIDPIANCTVL